MAQMGRMGVAESGLGFGRRFCSTGTNGSRGRTGAGLGLWHGRAGGFVGYMLSWAEYEVLVYKIREYRRYYSRLNMGTVNTVEKTPFLIPFLFLRTILGFFSRFLFYLQKRYAIG